MTTLSKLVPGKEDEPLLKAAFEILMHMSETKALNAMGGESPEFDLVSYLVDMVILDYEKNLQSIS